MALISNAATSPASQEKVFQLNLAAINHFHKKNRLPSIKDVVKPFLNISEEPNVLESFSKLKATWNTGGTYSTKQQADRSRTLGLTGIGALTDRGQINLRNSNFLNSNESLDQNSSSPNKHTYNTNFSLERKPIMINQNTATTLKTNESKIMPTAILE